MCINMTSCIGYEFQSTLNAWKHLLVTLHCTTLHYVRRHFTRNLSSKPNIIWVPKTGDAPKTSPLIMGYICIQIYSKALAILNVDDFDMYINIYIYKFKRYITNNIIFGQEWMAHPIAFLHAIEKMMIIMGYMMYGVPFSWAKPCYAG